jgi:hypothetical protein
MPGNSNRTPVTDGYMPHKYIPTFAIEKFGSLVALWSLLAHPVLYRVASALHLDIVHHFTLDHLVSPQFRYILAVYSVDR